MVSWIRVCARRGSNRWSCWNCWSWWSLWSLWGFRNLVVPVSCSNLVPQPQTFRKVLKNLETRSLTSIHDVILYWNNLKYMFKIVQICLNILYAHHGTVYSSSVVCNVTWYELVNTKIYACSGCWTTGACSMSKIFRMCKNPAAMLEEGHD